MHMCCFVCDSCAKILVSVCKHRQRVSVCALQLKQSTQKQLLVCDAFVIHTIPQSQIVKF